MAIVKAASLWFSLNCEAITIVKTIDGIAASITDDFSASPPILNRVDAVYAAKGAKQSFIITAGKTIAVSFILGAQSASPTLKIIIGTIGIESKSSVFIKKPGILKPAKFTAKPKTKPHTGGSPIKVFKLSFAESFLPLP
jgi:hypothetical protein